MTADPMDQAIADAEWLVGNCATQVPLSAEARMKLIELRDTLASLRPAAGGEAVAWQKRPDRYEMGDWAGSLIPEQDRGAWEPATRTEWDNRDELAAIGWEIRALYTHPAPAAREAVQVRVGFPGIGDAGPFDLPVDGHLVLPEATMADLAHHFRTDTAREAAGEGMVLVPKEATLEMMVAYWQSGSDKPVDTSLLTDGDLAIFRKEWRDVLAAAPPPQAKPQEGEAITCTIRLAADDWNPYELLNSARLCITSTDPGDQLLLERVKECLHQQSRTTKFTPPAAPAGLVEWDGAKRTMQEHLYLMTGERDRYKAIAEQAAPSIERMERRIAELSAAPADEGREVDAETMARAWRNRFITERTAHHQRLDPTQGYEMSLLSAEEDANDYEAGLLAALKGERR